MSTASALEREIECPASAVLSPIVNESGEDAERGHAIHVFCRSIIAGTPRAIALAQMPEGPWRETCEQIDFAILCGDLVDVRAEVSYRITTHEDAEDTVRELGLNLNRRYPARAANDTDGTNDFEGRKPLTGTLVVTDIKTGFWPVTACKDNPQMKFHARALMLKRGVSVVEARIAYIGVGGEISFDTHVFTRLDLDTYADVLLERKAKIARANEALKVGRLEVHADEKWCRYCPAKISCPKFTALAHAMLGDLRDAHAKWGELTKEQRAEAFMKAYESRELAEMIIESQKSLVRMNLEPLPLPGGKELRQTSSGVRVVNAPKPTTRRRVA